MYHSGVAWVFFSKQILFTLYYFRGEIRSQEVFVTCITSLDTILLRRDLPKRKGGHLSSYYTFSQAVSVIFSFTSFLAAGMKTGPNRNLPN